MSADLVSTEFVECFGHLPDFTVRSPGRVNLIGDHTDYTGGLVLPIAIDRSLLVGARIVDGTVLDVCSAHFDQRTRIPLDKPVDDPEYSWAPYVAGVAAVLKQRGIDVRGAQLFIGGDLPPGAGLGSSAALEVGVATALLEATRQRLSPVALATLCRQVEHEHANSPCGIMDQLCCTSARADHALLIDCRTMKTEHIPLKLDGAALVVIDTGVRHSIAEGEYARRRRECAAALGAIMQADASISSLRDIDEGQIGAYETCLDETLVRRVRHVVTENSRVSLATDALWGGTLAAFGELMTESHASLNEDFDVSCDELNDLVSIALRVDGVLGARMTGGGFGGCVVALASTDSVPDLVSAIHELYDGRYDADALVYPVQAVNAVGVLEGNRDA